MDKHKHKPNKHSKDEILKLNCFQGLVSVSKSHTTR